MNTIQKNILVNARMPRKAPLSFLLGRTISFTFNTEERTLLITDAREVGEDVIISFHSCVVFGSRGLLGLLISPKGQFTIKTYHRIGTVGGLTEGTASIDGFVFS